MKCPKCKAEIDHVNVYSQCLQVAHLKGKAIESYEPVDSQDILETLDIECTECGESLIGVVEE